MRITFTIPEALVQQVRDRAAAFKMQTSSAVELALSDWLRATEQGLTIRRDVPTAQKVPTTATRDCADCFTVIPAEDWTPDGKHRGCPFPGGFKPDMPMKRPTESL